MTGEIPPDLQRPLLYRVDPVAWVTDVLEDVLPDYQQDIMRAVAEHGDTSVASCHGVGKDYTAARIALWFAKNFYPATVVATAPTSRQLSKIFWKELKLAHRKANVALGGRVKDSPSPEIKWDENWRIFGFTAPDYDANKVQGIHEINILVIVDEACGVTAPVFEGLDGLLTSTNAKMLRIGNPTDPTGEFADSFNRRSVHKIRIGAFQTPNFTHFGITPDDIATGKWAEKVGNEPMPWPMLITPKWVADKYEKWGPESPLYVSRVLGQFPDQGEDTLIPMNWINSAIEREVDNEDDAVELGVDVARFGSDETVIAKRKGDRVEIIWTGHKQDTMATTGHVVRSIQETGATISKVDVIGIGAGVVDRLRELDHEVLEVNSAEAPVDTERFRNARAEWWWEVRDRFEDGTISIPDDEELISQLSSLRYKITSSGKIEIERKADAKKRGVASPDRADAVMHAFTHSGLDPIIWTIA